MIIQELENIADEVLAIDESKLSSLLQHYKNLMAQDEPNRSWERAVVAYFLINAVRVKNGLKKGKRRHPQVSPPGQSPHLRLVRAS